MDTWAERILVCAVISFAKATGDLQTLSDVDLKLIALTHTLESQIHGTSHLRDTPPPIRTVNVKRLPEKDLPGWGSNVPNLSQWEALEHAIGDGSGPESRILPLKDLNMNVVVPGDKDRCNEDPASENGSEALDNDGFGKSRKYLPKKKEVVIEGKKMVADGIDASQGQFDDDDNAGDWLPAVSRSTHRRFLRRKARRERYESSEKDDQNDGNEEHSDDTKLPDLIYENTDELCDKEKVNGVSNGDEDISTNLDQLRIQDGEGNETGNVNRELEQLDVDSVTNESVDESTYADDSSEQSWTLRSLSESSVACVTADFAMQNVILQMGLRLVAPGGMQIRELHRFVFFLLLI